MFPDTPRPSGSGGAPRDGGHVCPVVGGRRQKLVFIGVGLDERALHARLDAVLLTEPSSRGSGPLPRPSWEEHAQACDCDAPPSGGGGGERGA
ncbi:GTP-binding protein [Archangium lansingense]|uniref:GTP-binding protein n=1 Tax=Archangium lansingense TaxID=2995310 RepID=UPI00358DAC5E